MGSVNMTQANKNGVASNVNFSALSALDNNANPTPYTNRKLTGIHSLRNCRSGNSIPNKIINNGTMPHAAPHQATGRLNSAEDSTIPNAAGLHICFCLPIPTKYLPTDANTTATKSVVNEVGSTMSPMSKPVITDESDVNQTPSRMPSSACNNTNEPTIAKRGNK